MLHVAAAVTGEFCRESARSALPWGLVGMIGLVACCEQLVAGHDLCVTGPIPAGWRASSRAASQRLVDCRVLCFGDSQVRKGILPRVLQSRVGGQAYNLAVVGGQTPSSFYLLKHALRAGTRPSALVINGYPGLLASDPRINLREWPELLTVDETFELAWHARDAQLLATTLLARLLPSLKARQEIRAVVAKALRGEACLETQQLLAQMHAWRLERGAEPLDPNPHFADAPVHIEPAPPGRVWKPKPVNAAYARRFLALAAERGIPVFWLLPTLSPSLQYRRAQLGLDAPYERFLDQLGDEFPNLVFCDARRLAMDVSHFADHVHLDRRGAACLSLLLAGQIDAFLRGQTGTAARGLAKRLGGDPNPETQRSASNRLHRSASGVAVKAVPQPGAGVAAGHRSVPR